MIYTHRLRITMVLLLFALLITPIRSARAEDFGSGSDTNLVRAIDKILDVPGLQPGFQGILIQSLSDNAVLYERNADHIFMPASNNKLLTSGAALALLGKDFTYHTRIYRTGPITPDGTLRGDLVIQGAGDPILTPDDMKDLAWQVSKAGIRYIAGDVYADDSLFDREWLGDVWAWDDEPYYYSAQISALNVNENVVRVQVTPGHKAGDPLSFTIEPTDRYTQVLNTGVTGPAKSKSTLIVDRVRGRNILVITGSLPLDVAAKDNGPVPVTIENPALFSVTLLAEDLRSYDIAITGHVRGGTAIPKNATLVAEHVSPPLSVILRRLNKPSDNLIAECLMKTIGAVKTGKGTGGLDGTGEQTARDWYKRVGLDMACVQQADGSGLSRENFVSPRNLVRLLTYLHNRPDFDVFYQSLPIAGADGTLRYRLKGTHAAYNCHAKTGYISTVSSMSGYVFTREGQMLVFSMLMNNHVARNSICTAAQDAIVKLLADYTDKQEHQQAAASNVDAASRAPTGKKEAR
ncbi:MAG TPA: D-alanyl-D-alanine carboxypeptidase/D-alanyl-D-alanine-endopeptidase [Chthonomonadaceae bacterium]|nr:D-alanyl-D-alanine carboxypeptidase/D-alanyl-D-alanine-endopeptidase [Chthonomonadaceae bacterium]